MTPYNAGLSFDVPNEVVGPVSTIHFGTITVTENWGRLFIKQGDQQIILLQSAYPNFVETIEKFIEHTEAKEPQGMIDMKQLLADREAGTQGPMHVNSTTILNSSYNAIATTNFKYAPEYKGEIDARRFARVDKLEQALIDAVEESETAFFRGVAYAQTITPNGTLTVIDSVETVKLRRELIDARAALEAIERECSNSLGNESEIDGTQIIMLCKKGLGQ